MNYRKLGNTGMTVSEVGLGCEHLQGKSYELVSEVINRAIDSGVNIFDVFMSEPQIRSDIGKAMGERRSQVIIQGHIGAGWIDGQYKRTRDIDQCKFFFADLLDRLGTDYIDIGMIHYVDTQSDYDAVFGSEIIKYAHELKKSGAIRAVGISSHDPVASLKAVESGLIDVLMFSINPAYDIQSADTTVDDLFDPETFANNKSGDIDPIREKLYRACEANGVGITVMKAFGAGSLLSEKRSPFGAAMTTNQCIHYCLTRPGVASVLPGCQTVAEVDACMKYVSSSDDDRDFSKVLAAAPKYSMKGRCMYCNHCLPCVAHIDIAAVNKYLDMADFDGNGKTPATVKDHYMLLENHAQDCIECGMCESNCPFDVSIIARMNRAAEVFGM